MTQVNLGIEVVLASENLDTLLDLHWVKLLKSLLSTHVLIRGSPEDGLQCLSLVEFDAFWV